MSTAIRTDPSFDDLRRLLLRRLEQGGSSDWSTASLYGEGRYFELEAKRVLLRLEDTAGRLGDWFVGGFATVDQARFQATALARLGRDALRNRYALPRIWGSGSGGNRIKVISIYRLRFRCPAVGSWASAQREGGTVMLGAEHLRRLRAGEDVQLPPEYEGGAYQLLLPIGQVRSEHPSFSLLELIGPAETPVLF